MRQQSWHSTACKLSKAAEFREEAEVKSTEISMQPDDQPWETKAFGCPSYSCTPAHDTLTSHNQAACALCEVKHTVPNHYII